MRLDGKAEGIRQSMSWLHTWTGIVLGWVLYVVFFTGTLSYFLDEINLWMKPELHASMPTERSAEVALAGMQKLAPEASVWTLDLPTGRQTTVQASWREKGQQATGRAGLKRAELDAGSGDKITPRETRGGNFLYRFHFELHSLPRLWTRWFIGIATMFMFVAIISGVITHKKIFTEFFTFRPKKGQRSWLDAHNATAVLALPFHLMITFSGLLLFMAMLMPWAADAVYKGDSRAFFSERRGGGAGNANLQQNEARAGRGDGRRERGSSAPAVDLVAALPAMLVQARGQWTDTGIGTIVVNRPNQAGSTVELREQGSASLSTRGAPRRLLFDAASGKMSEPPPRQVSAASAVYNVLTATHLGHFAGTSLRWLLFLSGVVGTAMVGTGLVLWVVKRLPERQKLGYTPWGHRLVEKSNIAVISGLALATAAYFWSNRLIPAGLAGRTDWEINAFFLAWLAALLHAIVRPSRAAWIEQCIAVAVLFALLPVLNPMTGGHGLATSVALGQTTLAAFDLAMLSIAALFAFIARRLWLKARAPAKPAAAKARSAAEAVLP